MRFDGLLSRRWLVARFLLILVAAAAFHLVIYRDLQSQRELMFERGFTSPRLEELSRVEKEFTQVFELAHRYVEQRDSTTLENVQRALDILWSRANSVLDKTYQKAYGADVDISLIAQLKVDLPKLETAIGQLRPKALETLEPVEGIWNEYRQKISDFSDSAYGARVRILQDNNLGQWQLFSALKKYQLAFTIYGGALLLLLLAELLWANRIVGRLKGSNERNRRLANTDHLTGLYNRRSLDHHLAGHVKLASEAPLSAIAIDIDRFRSVNDSFGHAIGDRLLVEVAARISQTVDNGLVGRMSSDEFIVLIDRPVEGAQRLAQRLCKAIAQPFDIGDRMYEPSASVAVVGDIDGMVAEEIIQSANAAMLEAKAQGGGQVVRFRSEMMRNIRERAVIESDLPDAIKDSRIEIVVQPKFRLADRSVHGFEALARWQHPELGWVSPEKFCGIADASGYSSALGLRIADLALQVTATARAKGFGGRMSINVSPAFGSHPTFVADMQALLAKHGLKASDIEFEVTEEAMMSEASAVRDNMTAMRKLGAAVAIDDFGKGHSNISRLTKLSVSVIKVDKTVIGEGVEERSRRAIIKSLVQLARELEVELIVEGVETEEQARSLVDLGVLTAQGYLFARPMPPLKLISWLAEQTPPQGGAAGRGLAVA